MGVHKKAHPNLQKFTGCAKHYRANAWGVLLDYNRYKPPDKGCFYYG